jgi:hypothetical protein
MKISEYLVNGCLLHINLDPTALAPSLVMHNQDILLEQTAGTFIEPRLCIHVSVQGRY